MKSIAATIFVACLAYSTTSAIAEQNGLAAVVQSNLRAQQEQHDAVSSTALDQDNGGPWYMYVSGKAPLCDGECDDVTKSDITLRTMMLPFLPIPIPPYPPVRSTGGMFVEYWSGNTDAYGKMCYFGFKRLCATKVASSRSSTTWDFPMCGKSPVTGKGCQLCSGCPKGTVDVGEWSDTNNGVCCLPDFAVPDPDIATLAEKLCKLDLSKIGAYKARRCRLDPSQLNNSG